MYTDTNNSVLYVIPARTGSKRLPGKNVLPFGDTTLVQETIRCALTARDLMGDNTAWKFRYEDRASPVGVRYAGKPAVVVTADGDWISHYEGATWIPRPEVYATDDSDISSAVRHALITAEAWGDMQFGWVVTLQPAVPVRTPRMIARLVRAVQEANAGGGLVGVRCHPWIWAEGIPKGWQPHPYPLSQDMARPWQEINSIQVASRDSVLLGRRWADPLMWLLLPPHCAYDIDTEADYLHAKAHLPAILDGLRDEDLEIWPPREVTP
jgi:CMP-N-acetylneuraminic acid synthetase